MNQVFYLSHLSGQYIKQFVGKKTYADSVSVAKEFAARTGVELKSYFQQLLGKRAILVGYDIKRRMKMKITLDEVSEHLDGYHQYTNYGMALCPFHDDRNPSLMVWDRGFKCLSCGEHGSLNFLYEKVSGRIVIKEKIYNPSAKIWDKWLGIFCSIPNIAKVAHHNLLNTPDLAHYLITRKIDSQIKNGMFGYLDGWYTFPVRDEFGQVQGIVARASPTIQTVNVRYSVSPTCPIKLYIPDWKAIKNAEEIYVVFGTLDAWSMTVAGYPCVTGLSGQGLNSEHLTMRKHHWILPDWNEWQSGLNLQYEMGWRSTNLMLDYPDGCKDLNDIHMKYGIDKIQELIEKQKENKLCPQI